MSQATNALSDALSDQLEQFGETFTVGGVEGSFTGVVSDDGIDLSVETMGVSSDQIIRIVIARGTWTPNRNQVITLDGNKYTITGVKGRRMQWEITCALR